MLKKHKLLLGIITLILIISIPIARMMKKRPKKALAMPTVEVKKGDISKTVETSGIIETVEKQDVYAKIQGVITYVPKEGTLVNKGDVLLKVDNPEILLEQKRALYRLKREKTELSKLLAGPKREEVEKETVKLSEAKANYKQALLDYNRNKRLFDEGAISKHDLEGVEQTLKEKKTVFELAESDLSLLKYVDPLEIKAKEASVSEAESEYINAKNKAKDTVVYANIDGIVLSRDVSKGMVVSTGKKILLVGDVSKLQVSADVDEYNASKINKGQKAKITGEGFEGIDYEGKVTEIASVANMKTKEDTSSIPTSATLKVKIEIINADKNIKPGYLANAEIRVKNKKNVLLVPLESITGDDKNKKVVTVKDDKYVSKDVKTGICNELYIEITEGLSEGEKILQAPLTVEGENQ